MFVTLLWTIFWCFMDQWWIMSLKVKIVAAKSQGIGENTWKTAVTAVL